MNWVRSRLRRMWEVVYTPETAFAADLTGPSYLVPLFALGMISVALAAVQSPIYLEWIRAQLHASGASQEQSLASLELARRSTTAGLFATPLLLALRCLAHASLIWLTAQLLLVQLSFSQTFTIVAYSYIPVLVRDAVTCVILCMREPEALAGSEGLYVAIGLNLFFPQIPQPWWALAANVNLFEGWFVLLLVVGLAVSARTRWQKAFAAVFPVWLFTLLLQFGLVALGYQIKSQFARG